MASIPLKEIPNAPQGVSPQLANPQFPGDRVGDAAKADINRAFEGMKVNPLAAAVGGEMMIKAGQQIGQLASNIEEGFGYLQSAKNREDYATGQTKLLQNKMELDQQMADLSLNAPVEQHPVIYQQVYGGDKDRVPWNLFKGMTDGEIRSMQVDAMHDYAKGMATQVNTVSTFHIQQAQTRGVETFMYSLHTGDLEKARGIIKTQGDQGIFSADQVVTFNRLVDNKQDVQTMAQVISANKLAYDWRDDLIKAAETDSPVDLGHGVKLVNLSDTDKRNLANFATKVREDSFQEIASPLVSQIDAGTLTDPRILQADKGYQIMSKEWKEALDARITNKTWGTPVGIARDLDNDQIVDSFPEGTTKEERQNEYYEKYRKISMYSSPLEAKRQIEKLNAKQAELKDGGKLKEDTYVKTFGNQYLDAAEKAGAFGVLPTEKEIANNPQKAAEYLRIKQRIADIKQQLESGYDYGDGKKPIKTTDQMKAAIQSIMHPEEAAKITPKMSEGILDYLKRNLFGGKESTPVPEAKPSVTPQASSDGMIPVKGGVVTSYGYRGDTTPDQNSTNGVGAFTKHLIAGKSFGTTYDVEEQLRSAGIKPGDEVKLKLANGEVVTKIWHDRGATREQAKKMGLKNYEGRFDFYSPNGPDKRSGLAVVGFSKANNS